MTQKEIIQETIDILMSKYEFFTIPTKSGGTKRPDILMRNFSGNGSYAGDYDYGEWKIKQEAQKMYGYRLNTRMVNEIVSNIQKRATKITKKCQWDLTIYGEGKKEFSTPAIKNISCWADLTSVDLCWEHYDKARCLLKI